MSADRLMSQLSSLAWRALVSDRPGKLGAWKLEHPELSRIVERHSSGMISGPAVFQLADDLLFQALYTRECLLGRRSPSAKDRDKAARLAAFLTAHGDYRRHLLERIAGGQESVAPPTLRRRLASRPCERLRLVFRDARGGLRDFEPSTLERAVRFLFTSRSEELQLHYCEYEPRHFDAVRKAVEFAEAAEKSSKKSVLHILTFRDAALSRKELDFFKTRRFLLVFGENAPARTLQAALSAGLVYRVRAFGKGPLGFFEAFVRLAEAGHKSIQTCYDVAAPWSNADILKMLQELEKIAAFVQTRPGVHFANLEGIREPVVLNDELSLHADGGLFRALNLRPEGPEWPLSADLEAGALEGAGDIDIYQRTPFEVFRQLAGTQTRFPESYREILLGSLRAGFALDGWLRRKRATAGIGKLKCA